MFDKLRINIIYDDFVYQVNLTKEQKEIIKRIMDRDTYVKIGLELGMSDRTVGTEARKIKKLYDDYVELQKSKYEILKK